VQTLLPAPQITAAHASRSLRDDAALDEVSNMMSLLARSFEAKVGAHH
jgi:hypothetical protein